MLREKLYAVAIFFIEITRSYASGKIHIETISIVIIIVFN